MSTHREIKRIPNKQIKYAKQMENIVCVRKCRSISYGHIKYEHKCHRNLVCKRNKTKNSNENSESLLAHTYIWAIFPVRYSWTNQKNVLHFVCIFFLDFPFFLVCSCVHCERHTASMLKSSSGKTNGNQQKCSNQRVGISQRPMANGNSKFMCM